MRQAWLLLLVITCGCGHARIDEHRTGMAMNEVPDKILKVAQRKFPDVKFDTAWKIDTGAIELRGKNKIGKIHAVELSQSGDLIEVN